jgi:prephenate dehydrogenase
MSDQKFTITIVGTGVIGTSLGMALKQQENPPRLLAHDKDLSVASNAVKQGAFDKAEWNLINACEAADLIVLAIPLSGVRATLEAIAPDLKPNAVITDTCPSKQPVLAWATELLPDHVQFVGGNPLVYATGAGIANASADLFRDRLYALTPAASANEEAVQLMTGLVSLVGAEPFFLDPAEHDGLLTAVEHLPRLLSVALMDTMVKAESWREGRKLAGRVFEQVSAGASGDPDGVRDNFLENQHILLHWMDHCIEQLHQLRALIAAGEATAEPLAQIIDQAVVQRENWHKDYIKGQFGDPGQTTKPDVEIPGFWDRWIGFGGFRKKRE